MLKSTTYTRDGKPLPLASSAPFKPAGRLNASDPINTSLYLRYMMADPSVVASGVTSTVNDLSNNRKPLVIPTAASSLNPAWVTNDLGPALQFDGSNDYTTSTLANGASTVASAHTVLLRCQITNTSATNCYTFNWGANGLVILFGFLAGQAEFYSGAFTGSDPRTSTAITWPDSTKMHSIVYTYSAGTQKGYLDGVLTVNLSKTYSLTNTGTGFVLGASSSGSANPFPSIIDHFAIWSRALSDEEVRLVSANPLLGIQSGY